MGLTPPLSIGVLRASPVGDLWIAIGPDGLTAIAWALDETAFGKYLFERFGRPAHFDPLTVAPAIRQLDEYLHGARRAFTLPIDWSVLRPFQRQTLQIVYAIPYGETRTYGEIARQMGKLRAVRAVGRANAANPMPLVIPCHRVIGSDGKLHGYRGGKGLPTKEWLLKLEGALIT